MGMCQPALVGQLISMFIPTDPNVTINVAQKSGRNQCINLCLQLKPKVGVQERFPLQPPTPEVLQNTIVHILAFCHNPQNLSPRGDPEGRNARREFCPVYCLHSPFQGLRDIARVHRPETDPITSEPLPWRLKAKRPISIDVRDMHSIGTLGWPLWLSSAPPVKSLSPKIPVWLWQSWASSLMTRYI